MNTSQTQLAQCLFFFNFSHDGCIIFHILRRLYHLSTTDIRDETTLAYFTYTFNSSLLCITRVNISAKDYYHSVVDTENSCLL